MVRLYVLLEMTGVNKIKATIQPEQVDEIASIKVEAECSTVGPKKGYRQNIPIAEMMYRCLLHGLSSHSPIRLTK